MIDVESKPVCTIHVDPANMAERIFHYDDPDMALHGLVRAQELVEGDPGIKSALLRQDKKRGGFNLILAVSEASHWMSSSRGQPGTVRQAFLLGQLRDNPLVQTRGIIIYP